VTPAIEEQIVALRKELADLGVDAGAHTIHYHLRRQHRRNKRAVPAVATIWRVLSRRGFVVPQPHKRPKSSWRRFAAELPNECWQAEVTHWALADGSEVEILNIIDDHSRLLVASGAFATTKAADVVGTFHLAASELGFPASMLTDNGAIFSNTARGPAPSSRSARLGHRLQALPPLPPADLRQGRTLPSDPQEAAGPAIAGPAPWPPCTPIWTGSGPMPTPCPPM
jgi:transposase InsO family protein